jgi:hypothetical protein
MSSSPEGGKSDNKPFFLLDPGTKGGAMFYMSALFVVPYLGYLALVASGMDEIQTGIAIGIGFTILSTLIWSSTYLFRVATKDMTYVSFLLAAQNTYVRYLPIANYFPRTGFVRMDAHIYIHAGQATQRL